MNVYIREANIEDLLAIKDVAVEGIRTCTSDYSLDQIRVWSSSIQTKKWEQCFQDQYFLIAEIDGQTTGFGSLENGSYIDYLYVSPKHLRKGVAQRITSKLLDEAKRLGKTEVTTHASFTAVPFFLKMGFKKIKVQTKILDGISISNCLMKLDLK